MVAQSRLVMVSSSWPLVVVAGRAWVRGVDVDWAGALVVGVVDHVLDEASDAVGNRCEGCPDGPSRSSDVDGLALSRTCPQHSCYVDGAPTGTCLLVWMLYSSASSSRSCSSGPVVGVARRGVHHGGRRPGCSGVPLKYS